MTAPEALTVGTVTALWHRREEIFASGEVQLGELRELDSAGIAFLVQWAKSRGGKLRLKNPPERLVRLISTYRLDPLFEQV